MKKYIFIYTILCLNLFACQDEEVIQRDKNSDKKTLNITMSIPDYQIQTRAINTDNNIQDIWLLVFDSKGLFLERVHANELSIRESSGSFTALVSDRASIIHVIANYDKWDTFEENTSIQKDERELLPILISNKMVFWGRSAINSSTKPINVTLFRNQAKVIVENNTSNFAVTGYALCNYISSGTVVPFIPEESSNPFIVEDDKPTLPPGNLSKVNQGAADCTTSPKYMFENQNYSNDQCYLIIKGKLNNGPELYYKIQFLDPGKHPYTIIRNALYRVVIESFSEQANGSTSFNDAMGSEASNNIYAEIFKDSPSISDNENNILTVSRLNFLFTQEGKLNVSTQYTENGTNANSKISVSISDNQANILKNLSYDGNGTITADITGTSVGQNEATIEVKAGVLSRIITVTSTALYSFEPVTLSPNLYTSKDQEADLSFHIPGTIPSYLYPLKCKISTNNLYPIEPNKDMEIEFIDGGYKYIYWVFGPGDNSLKFKTSAENSDETITIENDYFHTASVPVQSLSFNNVSINGNNIVNYGTGSTATIHFDISIPENVSVTFPLTIHIVSSNLSTTDPGWSAENGGYKRTYTSMPKGNQSVNLTSNRDISTEDIVLSANGFRNTTVHFDNILTKNSPVLSNLINVNIKGSFYYLPNYTVTSLNGNIVNSFTANKNSFYSFQIKKGTKTSDTVTFRLNLSNSQRYLASLTVQELLESPIITLK